jgi:peptidoglycan/xylan/chitin deacetylase (PgdA/CDA1 family)
MSLDRRVNICFHGIGAPARELEPGENPYWISTALFEQILDYVKPKVNVHLSFDDGNASDAEIALSSLAARGMRASFFPVAARIGQLGSIDRSGLRALIEKGMTVGSHGMHHQSWRGLDTAGLDEELSQARELIADAAGVPVSTAACPLGAYDRGVLRRLRFHGYAQVFTSDRTIARTKAWLQPRYSVRATDRIEDVQAMVEQPRPLSVRATSAARLAVKRLR